MYFIGMDIGSTSLNTVVLDDNLQVAEEIYSWCHGRPFHVLRDVLAELLSRYDRHTIRSLAFTGSGGELAAQLVRLLGDGEMRLRMGLKAREKAKSFSYSRIGRRWVSLYNSVLEEARSVRNG